MRCAKCSIGLVPASLLALVATVMIGLVFTLQFHVKNNVVGGSKTTSSEDAHQSGAAAAGRNSDMTTTNSKKEEVLTTTSFPPRTSPSDRSSSFSSELSQDLSNNDQGQIGRHDPSCREHEEEKAWKYLSACVSNAQTKGLFQDDWHTGNEVRHPPYGSPTTATFFNPQNSPCTPPPRRGVTSPDASTSNDTADSSLIHGDDYSCIQRANHSKSSPDCYYRVWNFCVEKGTIVIYRPPFRKEGKKRKGGMKTEEKQSVVNDDDPTKDFGTFRLCNELRSKFHLRYRIERGKPFPLSSLLKVHTNRNSEGTSEGRNRARNKERAVAHVAACWQYYGYHLFQCLAAMYAIEEQHGLLYSLPSGGGGVELFFFNHASSLPKLAREHYSHALYMGSPESFDNIDPDSNRHNRLVEQPSSGASLSLSSENKQNNLSSLTTKNGRHRASHYLRPAPFWKMWSQNTKNPADISEVRKFSFSDGSHSKCFHFGLVGQPNHHVISVESRRRHILRLKEILLTGVEMKTNNLLLKLNKSSSRRCNSTSSHYRTKFKVLIVQRSSQSGKLQGSRQISNLPEVMNVFQEFKVKPENSETAIQKTAAAAVNKKTHHNDDERSKNNNFKSDEDHRDQMKKKALFHHHPFQNAVQQIDWAQFNVSRQARLANDADVILSMHGAGNLWLAFQKPRSVFIEVWPKGACVARNVYLLMAKQYNIRYYPLCTGEGITSSSFLHQNVAISLQQLSDLLHHIYEYLLVTKRC